MLSIIKKEIRDGYIPLAVSIVLFMLGMSYFKGHDMANVIVFLFWAPVYMMLISQGAFVRERNKNTNKFLFCLPMTKKRLFLGKMLGSLITGLLIYLTFLIMMTALGMGGGTDFYEVVGIEIKPIFVYCIFPLGAWVIGGVAGLLHPIVSASFLLLIPLILASPFLFNSPGIFIMNPVWVLFIVLFFGFILSYKLFENSYEQNGWKWVFQSLKCFSIGTVSILALLFLLNYFGEVGSKSWNPVFGVSSQYISGANKFLVNIGRQTNIFDLIPGETNDVLVFNDDCIKKDEVTGHYKFLKQDVRPIHVGNRYTYPSRICESDDGNNILFRSNSSWVHPDKRLLYSLNTLSKKSILVSPEAYPLAYTSNGNILFYTFNNDITGKIETYRKGWSRNTSHISVQLYDKLSHSSKEICVVNASTNFSRTGRKIIADSGIIPVIDLDTLAITSLRKQLQLPKDTYSSIMESNPYFATIAIRKLFKNKKSRCIAILQYTSNGEIIKTKIDPEGHANMEFSYVDGSKDGNICFILERDYLDKSETPEKLFIATKDKEPLLIAEHLYIRNRAVFSNSGKYLCLQYRDNQEDKITTAIVDVQTKQIVFTTKDRYIYCDYIKPFRDDYFIATAGLEKVYFGYDTNNSIISLFNIEDEFGK